jgi:hypothetical protein
MSYDFNKKNTSKIFGIDIDKIIAAIMILFILVIVILGLYDTYLYITKPLVPVYNFYATDLGMPMYIDAIAMVISWISTPIILLLVASAIYSTFEKKDTNIPKTTDLPNYNSLLH